MKTLPLHNRVLRAVLVILAVVVIVLPLYWMVATAFKPNAEILGATPTLIPRNPTWDNFTYLFTQSNFGAFLANSLIVATSSTVIALAIGTSGGYALSRFPLFGKRNDQITFGMLVVRALPPILLVIPIYLTLRTMDLLNSLPGLILVYSLINVPFVVWMMRSFFDEVPQDLDEAARTDGAGTMRTFAQVILPLTAPGIAATAILTFINVYNEFLFALTITTTPAAQTVPVGTATLIGRIEVQWGPLAAGGIIAMLPAFLFVLLMQRHLVRGLTAGAVK